MYVLIMRMKSTHREMAGSSRKARCRHKKCLEGPIHLLVLCMAESRWYGTKQKRGYMQ